MKTIYVGSAYSPKEVAVSEDNTIREIYEANNLTLTSNTMVTLNSRRLGDAELNQTIEELGIEDGDAVTITEKYASANI